MIFFLQFDHFPCWIVLLCVITVVVTVVVYACRVTPRPRSGQAAALRTVSLCDTGGLARRSGIGLHYHV